MSRFAVTQTNPEFFRVLDVARRIAGSVAFRKASTLFDELVLPGRSQKLATKRQSATNANSGWWLALPRFLGL
jgi:hypothetical protein